MYCWIDYWMFCRLFRTGTWYVPSHSFSLTRTFTKLLVFGWFVHGFPSQSQSVLHNLIESLQVKTELKHVLEAKPG